MGIIAAIISVLSAIASAVASALSAIIKVTPWWVYVGFALVGCGMYLGNGCSGVPSGCSCRDVMGCRPPRPPRPPHSQQYGVVEVPTGASIVVQYGLMGKKRATVALAHIQAPLTGPEAEASVEALSLAAGDVVKIEWQRGGILRGTADDADPLTGLPQQEPVEDFGETTGETLEALGPIVDVVYGQGNVCLQEEQLRAGLAKANEGAPKSWRTIENEAHKARRGMWATNQ